MAAVAGSAAVRPGADRKLMHQSSSLSDQNSEFQRDVRHLVDLLSKLNPSAKEFFPTSYFSLPAASPPRRSNGVLSADAPVFVVSNGYNTHSNNKDSGSDGSSGSYRMRRINHDQGRRRVNEKVLRVKREDRIRRTVYVSDIDQFVILLVPYLQWFCWIIPFYVTDYRRATGCTVYQLWTSA